MKKFLFLLTGLMFMLASCGGSEDETTDPTPTPKPNEPTATITMNTNIPSGGLAFDVNGGEKSVSFSTNKDWSVTVAATTGGTTWCTASPTSGSQGDATVKFSVKENTDYDDRIVSVTIKAGTATKTFTINQKGADALLITTKKYEVAQAGEEIEVEVQANIDYEMEISETAKSWIAEVTTRALTTHKHIFTIAANEEAEKREGEIIFKSGNKVETVTVYQAGGPVLVLSKNEFNVSDAGETITIEVKSNIDFGVQLPDVDWIVDEASTRGMSSHTLKYDVLPNETYDAREAEIIFYDKNSDLKETVMVVQAQKDAIIISQKNYEVKAEGETIEVKLSANVDFDVTMPDVDWISQVTTRGLTEHTLYYSVAENTGEDCRSAEIVFTDKESQLSEKITIIQIAPINSNFENGVATLAEPNWLEILLGEDYLEITSLKVVGFINGNDVHTLRMMFILGKLVALDLSEAMIVKGGSYSEWGGQMHTIYKENCICDGMFSGCANMQKIILPNSLVSIGERAFDGCSSLSSITIPNSVISIGRNAYYGCPSLKSVYISDLFVWCSKIDFDGNNANPLCNGGELYLNNQLVSDLVIPADVTEINKYTFQGCSSLTSVTIPNNVTSIGYAAFSGCSSMLLINLSDGLIEIGECAFSDCSSISSVVIPNSVASIGNAAFQNCSSLSSVVIPNNVTSIGYHAFVTFSQLVINIFDLSAWLRIDYKGSGCPFSSGWKLFLNNQEVTELLIPNDITEIRDYTFNGCSSLISVKTSNHVTSIGDYAFCDCSSLTSIDIPNSVITIGNGAFGSCYSLASITLPDAVTSIGNSAFQYCSSLATVICNATIAPILGLASFSNIASLSTLFVPKGCATTYSESDWASYFTTIEEK